MSNNMSNYIAAGFGGLMMIAAVGALIAPPDAAYQDSQRAIASGPAMDGLSAGAALHAEREGRRRAEMLARMDGFIAGELLNARVQNTVQQVWEFEGVSVPTTAQVWEFEGLTAPLSLQVWEFGGLTPTNFKMAGNEQVWEFDGLGLSLAQTGHHPETSPFTTHAEAGFHGYPTAAISRGGSLMTASGEALLAP